MRKFSAHRIYPVNRPPVNYGIIETTDDGIILNIRDTGGQPVEEAGLEFYSGIIIPGMVNTHCHLELSHLAGLIPRNTGLTEFVKTINKIRSSEPELIQRAAEEADLKMYREGISGAGDISNNSITLSIKQKSRIRYHTFIEIFGLDQEVIATRFEQSVQFARAFAGAGLPCSISPHAPYSMGIDLWQLIAREKDLTRLISIHHDESPEERELLEHRTGIMAEYFRTNGSDLSTIPGEAYAIDQLLGKYLPESHWILVHNTLTDPLRTEWTARSGVYWALCPRSNRYIENLLPDIKAFAQSGLAVCLGTDSLASNLSLSVLEEMKTIQEAVPEMPFDTLLQWATLNGALALGMEKNLGTIEPGKNPGLVNIPVFDWDRNRLPAESKSRRIV